MAIIAITTISSIKVKADFFFLCLAVISFGSRFLSIFKGFPSRLTNSACTRILLRVWALFAIDIS